MTKYHVNPSTGRTGVCKAAYQCRWGLSEAEHYESKQEAREAYEKKMEGAAVPAPRKLTKDDSERYTFLAGSNDPKVQLYAVYNGDEKTLRTLAKNPDASSQALSEAYAATDDLISVKLLERHPNFIPAKPTPEAITRLNNTIATSAPKATVASLLTLGEPSFARTALTSSNRNITSDLKQDAVKNEANSTLSSAVVNSPGFSVEEVYPALSPSQKLSVAIDSQRPEELDKLAHELYSEGVASEDANVSNLDIALAVYRNPSTSAETKERLRRTSSLFTSYDRAAAFAEKAHSYDTAVITASRERQEGARTAQDLRLNQAVIAEEKLSQEEVSVLVNRIYGKNLLDSSYNPRTGLFSGYLN